MADPTPRTLLERIGAWELGRTLGRGAYAHVRVAKHMVTGHEAACKILPALHRHKDRPATYDEMIDAVEAHKEVVLLKGLNGAKVPGIAGLEGVIEQGGWTYVFLTMYPYSIGNYPLPWSPTTVVPFFRKLLTALHHLHELDISHEDLKRSNILVDANNEPILVDFGFSHFNPDRRLVKSLGGTLDYSSPEKAKDKESRYDPKSNDIWSTGILLTKLLGFPNPYTTDVRPDTSDRLRQRIIFGKPSIAFTQAQVDMGMRKVLRGMLAVNPADRWTIPQILSSRFFRLPKAETLFEAPSSTIAKHTVNILPDHVVQDLCFLAYLNNEFFLCETDLKIREKLRSKEPCWEKRWAKILSKWSQREEMQWEDVPPPPKPKRVSVRSNRAPLREIKVDNKTNLTPVKHSSPKSAQNPARTPYQKPTSPLGRKGNVFSPKRKTRSVATMPLTLALQKMGNIGAEVEAPEVVRAGEDTVPAITSSPGHSSSSQYEDEDMADGNPVDFLPEAIPAMTLREDSEEEGLDVPESTTEWSQVLAKPIAKLNPPGFRLIMTRARSLATKEVADDIGNWSDRATLGSRTPEELNTDSPA